MGNNGGDVGNKLDLCKTTAETPWSSSLRIIPVQETMENTVVYVINSYRICDMVANILSFVKSWTSAKTVDNDVGVFQERVILLQKDRWNTMAAMFLHS